MSDLVLTINILTLCLYYLYPDDYPEWQELGFPVLGAVSGMLGCLMAIEAIKLLTGYGKPMLSKMLVFNAIDMEFRKLNIRRDEDCGVCGNAMKNEKSLTSVIPCDILRHEKEMSCAKAQAETCPPCL